MAKYFLLPKNGNFYKANLHCHSSFSDGKYTPQELKDLYMSMGYSIIAYTDHTLLIPHNELTDDKFLALNGYEMAISEGFHGDELNSYRRCLHINFISLDQNKNTQYYLYLPTPDSPIYSQKDRDKLHLVDYDKQTSENMVYPRWTPVYINNLVKFMKEHDFFVTYNHPGFNLETYEQYSRYTEFDAMEIANSLGLINGNVDYCPHVYDEMLRSGSKLFCVATDDNHCNYPAKQEWGKSWVMIKAGKLDYPTIAKALKNGDFYSSRGPEIKQLWIEDDNLHVECSEAVQITVNRASRKCHSTWQEDKPLTKADFKLDRVNGWFRVTITDKFGKVAHTNAYHFEDLEKYTQE